MSPDKKLEEHSDISTSTLDNKDELDNSKQEVVEQTWESLEWFDVSLIQSYLALQLVNKQYDQCSKNDQEKIEKISDIILKRIKQLQKVPFDITLSSWITTISNVLWSSPSTEKIQNNISNVSHTIDKIHKEYTTNIQKILWTWTTFLSWWKKIDVIENWFSELEKKISLLKNDKDLLKEASKKQNLSIKNYYKSQTRLYINDFIATLKTSQIQSQNINIEPQSDPIVEPLWNQQAIEEFIDKVDDLEWTKYKRWGEDERGIDCSWLIIEWWKKNGIIPESFDITAAGLYSNYVSKITNVNQIKRGDLIFYQNKKSTKLYKKWQISHVMIALWPVENDKIKIFDSSISNWVKERVISVEWNKKYEIIAWRPDSAYNAIATHSQLNDKWSKNAV